MTEFSAQDITRLESKHQQGVVSLWTSESFSKLIHVVGRIHFPVVIGNEVQFPCLLLAGVVVSD